MILNGQGLSRFNAMPQSESTQAEDGLPQKRPVVVKHAAVDRHDKIKIAD